MYKNCIANYKNRNFPGASINFQSLPVLPGVVDTLKYTVGSFCGKWFTPQFKPV